METELYLDIFQRAATRLDKADFAKNQLKLKVGIRHNSVVLKIQKATWCNSAGTNATFSDGIFFSVWISDELIIKNQLAYNIHALKLRELRGYSIKSREFAESFRTRFKGLEQDWPNVSISFGPLTLMEGRVEISLDHFEHVIAGLANTFLSIQFIIDDLLAKRVK